MDREKLRDLRERAYSRKCTLCGKFIPNKDFEEGLVVMDFTPDSEYSSESCVPSHRRCEEIEQARQARVREARCTVVL